MFERIKGMIFPDQYAEDEYENLPSGEGYLEVDNYPDNYAQNPYSAPSESSIPSTPIAQSQPEPMQATKMNSNISSMGNVIGMPGGRGIWSSAAEVLVLEPRAFEEMPQVIQALRERKSVVLNLSLMDPAQAQRAVDFVAGATYTIDGHQERVGENIFLFTPNCVQVRTQSGVIHEAPQPSNPSRITTTSWTTDPMLNRIAQ
jgi:cell division inhibitor SepF